MTDKPAPVDHEDDLVTIEWIKQADEGELRAFAYHIRGEHLALRAEVEALIISRRSIYSKLCNAEIELLAAIARAEAAEAQAAALREEVRGWRECALYDATMEGPKFKGWNRSALDRMLASAALEPRK